MKGAVKQGMLLAGFACLTLLQGSAEAADMASGLLYSSLNGSFARRIGHWQQATDKPLWLRDAELELRFEEGLRPTFSFAALIPLSPAEMECNTWFIQGRIAKATDDPWQSAFGIGWRGISKDHDRMIGVNVFADKEWRYERAKWGIGVEYFWRKYEARFNWYAPIGRPVEYVEDGALWRESVLGGYDVEIGTAMPRMPWLKLFVRGGSHGGRSSGVEAEWMLRTVLQISSRLEMDAGYRFGSGRTGELTIAFSYRIGSEQTPAMLEKGKPMFRSSGEAGEDLRDKRYLKVYRDWKIHVERVLIAAPTAVPVSPPPATGTLAQPGRVSVNIERGS